MTTRSVLVVGGLATLFAGAVGFGGACDGDGGAAGGAAGGGTATGGGGQTTTTSSSSSTTTSATGGGGAGGTGGAPDLGEEPIWAALPDPIATCTVEQLQNPSAVRAFYWKSCGQGCREAVFRPGWPIEAIAHGTTSESTHGVFVNLTLSIAAPEARWVAIIAREDGFVAQAFRTLAGTGSDCHVALPNTDGIQYGFLAESLAGQNHVGAGFGPLDGSVPTFVRDYVPAPTGIGPQIWSVFGPERWVWTYYPDKLLSVSSVDGSGPAVLAQYQTGGPIVQVDGPKWTGDQFLFEQVNVVGNTVQGVIARSDGLSPSETYLAPSDDSYFGQPEYAHSRLGWFRGYGQLDVNQFTSVEIWASPYSPDPASLTPYKVADWPRQFMPVDTVGGHGWLVTSGLEVGRIWAIDLETSEWLTLLLPGAPADPMGNGMGLYRLMGRTVGEVWALGRPYPVVSGTSLMARLELP